MYSTPRNTVPKEQLEGIRRVQIKHIAKMLGVPVEACEARLAQLKDSFGQEDFMISTLFAFLEGLYLQDLLAERNRKSE